MDIKSSIISLLKRYTKLKEITLEIPPSSSLGDYAFPCFELAKILKKNPAQIALDLASKIKTNSLIKDIRATGPYLNFFINQDILVKQTIKQIIKQKEKYGSSNIGKGKKMIIEHTSINPNASPHVGRARNAILGDSITKLLKFQNFDVKVHYFVNDVGKQIALLVLGFKPNTKFEQLLDIYIKINKNLTKEQENQAFNLLNKFEKNDKQTQRKFKQVVDICLKGQINLFNELGIKYNSFDFESSYLKQKKVEQVLKDLEKTGYVFKDEFNRKVLNQDSFNLASAMKNPVLVLTRADGTSLYPLRDLAYNIDKIQKAQINIVILGEDQKLYHQQVSAALRLLKKTPPLAIHYSFVLLEEGKMSTRQGNLVLLSDFMEEALKKSQEELKARYKNIKNLEKISKSIAYGAIKYAILKVSQEKNVNFEWSKALSFEGDSGPYLQYTYARAASILKKAKKSSKINYSLLTQEEKGLVKKLSEFLEIILKASINYRPHLIAVYLYELSKLFNEFYHKYNVLKSEQKLRNARIDIVRATKQVLNNGLKLLGIEPLERM